MPARLLLIAAAALLAAAGQALAVSNGRGDLLATFDARLDPSALPREDLAPVAVSVAGSLRSASGQLDRLPQLRRITVAINSQGQLFDRGLPTCRPRRIQPASQANARRACPGAVIGDGQVTVRVHLGAEPPFTVAAKLLVFNGPRRDGNRLILANAYAPDPPGSFLLTFEVERRPGRFGTVLSTTLPPGTRSWAYLTDFSMTLHRTYSWRGQRRSYLSAACAAPAGFATALFPFARTTYRFAGGQTLSMSEAARCRVTDVGG